MSKIITAILWLYAIARTVVYIKGPQWVVLLGGKTPMLVGAITGYLLAILYTVVEIFFFKP